MKKHSGKVPFSSILDQRNISVQVKKFGNGTSFVQRFGRRLTSFF
jgi:hypothetical protein